MMDSQEPVHLNGGSRLLEKRRLLVNTDLKRGKMVIDAGRILVGH